MVEESVHNMNFGRECYRTLGEWLHKETCDWNMIYKPITLPSNLVTTKLLGLLVSKFKRGGVNWSYKIFANCFTVYKRKKEQVVFRMNRLIMHNPLTQAKHIQIRIEIKQWNMAKADWFTFNSFEEHKICQKNNQEYSTQGFKDNESLSRI